MHCKRRLIILIITVALAELLVLAIRVVNKASLVPVVYCFSCVRLVEIHRVVVVPFFILLT